MKGKSKRHRWNESLWWCPHFQRNTYNQVFFLFQTEITLSLTHKTSHPLTQALKLQPKQHANSANNLSGTPEHTYIGVPHTYTVLHMFTQVLFWAGNQDNHQNFDPSLLPKKLWQTFMGMKQKHIFYLFFFKIADSKKTEIFKTANSQNLFTKIFEIVPWVDAKGIDVAQPIWLRDCLM